MTVYVSECKRRNPTEVSKRYRDLLKAPKAQGLDQWLLDWERTYTEAARLNLPDIQNNRCLFDFLNALRTVDMPFVAGREAIIEDKISQNGTTPTLKALLESYRNHLRTTRALAIKGATHSAFATLQGESPDGGDSKGHDGGSKGPPGWVANQEIQQQVDEKIEKSGKLKKLIKYIRDQAKKTTGKDKKEDSPQRKPVVAASFAVNGTFSVDAQSTYKLQNCWTFDPGSDIHVCNNKDRFSFERVANEGDMLVAGKTAYNIEAWGSCLVTAKGPAGPMLIKLVNVALASGFWTNIVSFRKIYEKGVHWDTQHDRLHKNGKTFCYTPSVDDHWVLEYNPPKPTAYGAFAAKSNVPQTLEATGLEWHHMLGHPSKETISNLEKSVERVKVLEPESAPLTVQCETCSLAKASQIISRQTDQEQPAKVPLERVGYDLIPMNEGYNGDNWVSHFRCFKSMMDFVYTHPRKNDALSVIKEFLAMVATRYNATVKVIRTDDERTLGLKYGELIQAKGITSERTSPYTPAQNWMTERAGGVLIAKARSVRIAASLPANMWPEVFKSVGYLSNRTPRKKMGWMTPFEALTGEKPSLSHLHPYGCKAYPLRHGIPRKDKLEPRAFIGYLFGYDSTNIFRIWVPNRMKIIRTRDVTFDHRHFYSPNDIDLGQLLEVVIENVAEVIELPEIAPEVITEEEDSLLNSVFDRATDRAGQSDQPEADDEAIDHSPDQLIDHPLDQLITPEQTPDPEILKEVEKGPSEVEITSSASTEKATVELPEVEILEDAVAMRTRSRKKAYKAALATTVNLTPYHSAFSVGFERFQTPNQPHLHRDELPTEPRHWGLMLRHRFAREWGHAAIREIGELDKKGTYDLVEKTANEKRLPLTWVFKYKFDKDGYLIKFKARLCVRGDLQTTEQETYAATLAARTFRALMAITAAFDLEIWQYDAVSAFVNSPLDEDIHCNCPDGIDKPGLCWKLKKALYGLKQAPILWYRNLTSALEDLGLWPVPGVNCLFINDWLMLFFYVDDIVVTHTKANAEKHREFETALLKRFEMKALGELKWFLGIRITRDRDERKIWLCQDSYITKIAMKFGLAGVKGVRTPLPGDWAMLANQEEADPQRTYAYQQRVGSINFPAVISRPDISFAASFLSQYLQNPTKEHVDAANHTISYLNSTFNRAIVYSGRDLDKIFQCASDAAFADDPLTRKISDGYLFQLYGGPIDWRAARQSTVTTSSTEAELLALTRTAKEAMWWKRFFEAIQFDSEEKLRIRCDNRQTLRIVGKEMLKLDTKLRHIDIHRHWLRQEVQAGRIDTEWVPTAEMPADGLTKRLRKLKHDEFVKQLNLVDITDLLKAHDPDGKI